MLSSMASTPQITVHHRIPDAGVLLGLVRAENVSIGPANAELANALSATIRRSADELDPITDKRRRAARDMLRNGQYKPTGRGKPANEYLLRLARQHTRDEGNSPESTGPLMPTIWSVCAT